MKTRYRVTLEHAEDGITVTFPDLPWGVSQGATVEDALDNAQDALVAVVTSLIHDGEDVPEPRAPKRDEPFVVLPEEVALKLALYRSFRAAQISKAELGRRLGWGTQQVARLFDAEHRTRIDHLFAAIHALGKRVEIKLVDAA